MDQYINKLNENDKVALALAIGEITIKQLGGKTNELQDIGGYQYCKDKLEMCTQWLGGEDIKLDDFFECFDNEDGHNLLDVATCEPDDTLSNLYGVVIEVVSITTVAANKKVGGGALPQYLEDVDDDYLLDLVCYAIDNDIIKKEVIESLWGENL